MLSLKAPSVTNGEYDWKYIVPNICSVYNMTHWCQIHLSEIKVQGPVQVRRQEWITKCHFSVKLATSPLTFLFSPIQRWPQCQWSLSESLWKGAPMPQTPLWTHMRTLLPPLPSAPFSQSCASSESRGTSTPWWSCASPWGLRPPCTSTSSI